MWNNPYSYDMKFYDPIKNGNPNGSGLPEWKLYESNSDVMELGVHVGPIKDEYLDLYNLLDQFLDSDFKFEEDE